MCHPNLHPAVLSIHFLHVRATRGQTEAPGARRNRQDNAGKPIAAELEKQHQHNTCQF